MSLSQQVADIAQNVADRPDSRAKDKLTMATRAYVLAVREYEAETVVAEDPKSVDHSE